MCACRMKTQTKACCKFGCSRPARSSWILGWLDSIMIAINHPTSTHHNTRHTFKHVEQPGSTPGASTKYVVPCTVGKTWDQYDWSMHGHHIQIGSEVLRSGSSMRRANY